MAGYIGSKAAVTQVDGYTKSEADDRYVNDTGDTVTFTSNEGDALLIEQADGTDVGSLRINNGSFILKGKHSTNPVQIQTHDGNEDIEVDPDGFIKMETAGSERLRIDASGTFMVGKTSAAYNTDGFETRSNGETYVSRSGTPMAINRNSSDGVLLNFYKDGSGVGSIGSRSGTTTYVEFAPNYAGFTGSTTGGGAILPYRSGAIVDNAIDLGYSSGRYDDIYATNGTIQTSDRNEKQDIAELTDAEQRVAVAAKGLLRKFRWKSAVAEKGDEARTHFGIIAQDLQAAFAAEGLDAGDYAMFISSTWTDEETGEERTRLGVRYSELLAFIIGAL
jgi:hypothetical protein